VTPLNSADLDRLVTELTPLVGARVQKVSQPEPMRVVVELRQPGRSVDVGLVAGPGAGRAAVVTARPPSPAKPYAFQGLLRARLTGAQLAQVWRPGPAAMGLSFAGAGGRHALLVEWDASGADLLLLDDAGRVLYAAGRRARERGVGRGQEYNPPRIVVVAAQPLVPVEGDPFPVSRAAELSEGRVPDVGAASLRSLAAPLRKAAAKLERTLEHVAQDIARADEAETWRRHGELLKANLPVLVRGASEAVVTEWTEEGPVEVRVPLSPQWTPRENVERYFHRHRRLTAARVRIEARAREVRALHERCGALLAEAGRAVSADEMASVLAAARAEGLLAADPTARRASQARAERMPYREITASGGRRVWVGRGARDNDALTFRFGRPNDVWLHARGLVGAHVVLPGSGPGEPPAELLLDAATLAAHFSSARGEGVVDVAWTRCRHVRRRKDAPPGAVLYTHDRTLVLRLEPERLARLLAAETTR